MGGMGELIMGAAETTLGIHSAAEGEHPESGVGGGLGILSGMGGMANWIAESVTGVEGGLIGTAETTGSIFQGTGELATEAGVAGAGASAALGALGGAAGGFGIGSGFSEMYGSFFGEEMSDEARIGTEAGLGLAGGVAGALCPPLAPFIAGAGIISELSGMASHALEESGHETAAEGVGILGMGGTGAALGAGIGTIVPAVGTGIGALVGGGLGLAAGGLMSLLGD